MSWRTHSGWPTSAIGKLAKAKKLKKRIAGAAQEKHTDSLEIKELERQKADLKKQVSALEERIFALRTQITSENRSDMAHVQHEIETLTNQAKAEFEAVPKLIHEFIKYITNGVDYSAGFQIVWYNERFVIMRLAGRRFFGGIGRRAYANAETKLYDLNKFTACPPNKKTGWRTMGSLEMERHCCVKKIEGRISAKTMKEWKEESEFVAT